MNDIVSRILEIMKKKNISASDLSKKINVQKSNISHILSRRNKPSLDFIIKLSNAFNDLSAEWLINGSQTSTPSNALSLQKKNENSKKKVNKIILFYEDNSFETYENF